MELYVALNSRLVSLSHQNFRTDIHSSTKAEEGHDINITFEEVTGLVGKEMAERLMDISLRIYTKARYGRKKGIIIADTKFEFGIYNDELILIDEVLTRTPPASGQ